MSDFDLENHMMTFHSFQDIEEEAMILLQQNKAQAMAQESFSFEDQGLWQVKSPPVWPISATHTE